MPWCPKCIEEYIEGFKNCPECNEPLQDSMPEKPDPVIHDAIDFESNFDSDYVEKELFFTESDIECTIITEALEKESILFRIEKAGDMVWQAYNLYSASSFMGYKVFVRKEDFEKAMNVYNEMQSRKNEDYLDAINEEFED